MNVYIYDKTFDGLLTAVFDAYFRKTFPDFLLSEGDALPLFYDELHTVVTDEDFRSARSSSARTVSRRTRTFSPPACGVACRRKSLLPRLAASPSVGCRNCPI